jgi:hypothetical protein
MPTLDSDSAAAEADYAVIRDNDIYSSLAKDAVISSSAYTAEIWPER